MLNRLAATTHLLSKELRLQRSNAVFTLAIILLGALALMTAKGAGEKIAGFSTEEIRIGLYITVLLPILIIVLPLMIGSTAAAAEKAAGVWAWQAALPISRRHIILTKVLIVALLCSIAAGIAPYILEYALPSDSKTNLSIFRAVWPGWVGLLCGAVGFYAGSLARADYQGLLISPIPLAALVFVMYIADPGFLVAPFGWPIPFWKEWALILRFTMIAALFIFCAATFVTQTRQRHTIRRIAAHATLIAAATFTLTLWNIITERTMISEPRPRDVVFANNIPTTFLQNFANMRILATVSQSDDPRFRTQINLPRYFGFQDSPVIFGSVSRDYSDAKGYFDGDTGHSFVITKQREIHEFGQAFDHRPTGITKNGRWMLAEDEDRKQFIFGPMGFTIDSNWLSDNWFSLLRGKFDFAMIKDPRNIPIEIRNNNTYTNTNLIDYGGITTTADKEVITVSEDMKWALRFSNSYTTTGLTQIQGPPYVLYTGTTRPAQLKQWVINKIQHTDAGTTIELITRKLKFPMTKISGENYAWFEYRKTGPISIGGNVITKTFPFETGIFLVNLQTGDQGYVPISIPWPADAVMALQSPGAYPNDDPYWFPWMNIIPGKSGTFAAIESPYCAIVKLAKEDPKETLLSLTHTFIPGVHGGQFFTETHFLTTDGRNLWMISPQ